jgi:hypothetical protein
MSWYKIFSGLPQDARLAVVAKRAGARRGDVLAIWLTLLDHASAAKPRGSIKDADAEEIAATLECDTATVEAVITALRDRKMILPEGVIAGWSKKQKLSTPRTRAYRARVAAAAEETDAARRLRLQNEINLRHKKHGLAFADSLNHGGHIHDDRR